MCVNNLSKVATQLNNGTTRESNRGPRVQIASALTTKPLSHTNTSNPGVEIETPKVSIKARQRGEYPSLQSTRKSGSVVSFPRGVHPGRKQVLVHFEIEKRIWCVSVHKINRIGCTAYRHCDNKNCRYGVPPPV